MRLGSTNICLQRALRDDRDPRLGSLPHTKIPDSVETQKDQTSLRWGLPARAHHVVARGFRWPGPGGRGPRAAMRPRSMFSRMVTDPGGSLQWGTLPVLRPPLPQSCARPGPCRLPSPRRPPTLSTCPHRAAPSPTSRGCSALVLNGPGTLGPAGPTWPPALAPAWPPGGLSRVAASRLAVPRPASLQRHPAGPNRHPSRQLGRAPASPRIAPLPARARAAIAAAPFCPPPRPPRSSVSRSRPKSSLRAGAPCPLSPRANALTRPRPLAASPTAASEPAAAAAAAASSAAAAAAHGS